MGTLITFVLLILAINYAIVVNNYESTEPGNSRETNEINVNNHLNYTEEALLDKVDSLAIYLEYDSFEALIKYIDTVEGEGYIDNSLEEQIKNLGEYIELTPYEIAVGSTNRYSLNLITNLMDYLDYIYDSQVDYYEKSQ